MNSIFHRLFQSSPNKSRLTSMALCVGLSSFSVTANAYEDVLDTPAMPSRLADQTLLVDIENVGNRLIAVGQRGHVIYSDNQGSEWQQAQVPVSVLLTAIDFVGADKGWAVGHGGVILHSNDGGANWTKQFDGNEANQAIIDQAAAYVAELEFELDEAGGADEDLEYELEEAQFALEDAEFDAEVGAAKPFLDVLFLDDKVGFAIGAYGYLFATKDGGRTWENHGDRLDNLDRFHLNTIAQLSGGHLMIAGEAGVIFRSSDMGETWESVDSPYDGSFFGIQSLEEKDSALIFGLRGNLFRTANSGDSWKRLESNTDNTLVSGATDGNRKVTLAGNAGIVLVSRDGGLTFSSHNREDRLSHTALTYITRQTVALVGESGVELVGPSGKNL